MAEKFINKEKRRLKPKKPLDRIPIIDQKDVDRENYGVKIELNLVQRKMMEILAITKNAEIKLEDLLETQKWSNLDIIAVPEKGEGVFTRDRTFKKGQVVCDYHGIHRNKKAAETIAKEMEGGAGNYMFYYRTPKGESKCVDAATYPCGCHDMRYGRWINHSCKKDNLTPTLQMVDGKNHILLIAKVDIPPNTELLFDYGVRCGNKEKISWLKE
ncbi:hypothetical protein FSP39_017813 [Pinctada imbricata]|uniref:SET domain-containing protein n=1 Tax=Pinctada imbricata TaxID=66713 RepID=A0AA88YU79_PINIB|nr:hypothetical protein FSP39_017813 [Pinctada imbricata]